MKHKTIVKLTTNMYHTDIGAYIKKELRTLKRKSCGYDLLNEDIGACDVESVLSRIINIYTVSDGIYQLVTINESRDYETGYLDDWDYKLIPL